MTRSRTNNKVFVLILAAQIILWLGSPVTGIAGCPVAADTLKPLVEFAGRAGDIKLEKPAVIRAMPDQTIVIVDAGNSRLVRVNQVGELLQMFGSLGSEHGEFNAPAHVAVNDSILVVADRGNHRLVILSTTFDWLLEIPMEVPVDYVALDPAGNIYACCNIDKPGDKLFDAYDNSGKSIGSYGALIGPTNISRWVTTSMNRIQAAWTKEGRMMMCYTSVAHYVLGPHPDTAKSQFTIACVLNEAREWFYNNHDAYLDIASLDTTQVPTLGELQADIVAVNQDHGRYINYATDLRPWRDRFLLLTSGIVHVYDESGSLVRRLYLKNGMGEQFYASSIAVIADNVLYALDGAHTYRCAAYSLESQ